MGITFSANLAADGGEPPYLWSLESGSLPEGLALSNSGLINGAALAPGNTSFTVRVTDNGNRTASQVLSIRIQSILTIVQSTTLPTGIVGSEYSHPLAATGGVSPYIWSMMPGSSVPGLFLSSAGVLSGTPSVANTFSFTIQVKDNGPPQQTVTQSYSIQVVNPLRIESASPLNSGAVGLPFSKTLEATGGTPPYAWSLLSGQMPSGIELSQNGEMSGRPTAADTFNFVVKVTDSGGLPATKPFTLTVYNSLAITSPSPLPTAVLEAPYSVQLQASISSTLNWTVGLGSLPPGLTLSTSGLLGGNPTATGTFDFEVQVTGGDPVQSANQSFRLAVNPALTITTPATLPDGIVSIPYSVSLIADGGIGPYTWALTAGTLSAGLTLSGSGLVSGTPSTHATSTFTIQVRDSSEPPLSLTRAFTLATGSGSLRITTSSLAGAIQNSNYAQQLQATGGTPPYTWTTSAGSLPVGLTLSTAGMLSGIPTTTGSKDIPVNLSDARGTTTSLTLPLMVFPPMGALSIPNIPATLAPAQQTGVNLSISSPYPATLTGELRLSFAANSAVPVDDPMVRFSNGTRAVSFEIPANSTAAIFSTPVMLLTGTVAGTIQMMANIRNGPTNLQAGIVDILPVAPQLTNVVAAHTPAGIEISVTGYSPVRSVSSVGFAFDVRTTSGIQRLNLNRSVETDFSAWYQNPVSAAFGSAFLFSQSFNVQGEASGIETVTITLTNQQGSSTSSPVRLIRP
jgi:hypothetical protein